MADDNVRALRPVGPTVTLDDVQLALVATLRAMVSEAESGYLIGVFGVAVYSDEDEIAVQLQAGDGEHEAEIICELTDLLDDLRAERRGDYDDGE